MSSGQTRSKKSGAVEKHYMEELYHADVVLADVTFWNPNVFYELGIRQALSQKGAVLVAASGTSLPFDVKGQRVWFYDPGNRLRLKAFQQELRAVISKAVNHEQASPVHECLPGLYVRRFSKNEDPESKEKEHRTQIELLKRKLEEVNRQRRDSVLIGKVDAANKEEVLAIYKHVMDIDMDIDAPTANLFQLLKQKLFDFHLVAEGLHVFELSLRH